MKNINHNATKDQLTFEALVPQKHKIRTSKQNNKSSKQVAIVSETK